MKKILAKIFFLAIITILTVVTTNVKAETVSTTVPTIQPKISCTATFLGSYQSTQHDVDVNKDNEITLFDLIRMKESIVYDTNNIYTIEDLIYVQNKLLGISQPYLCCAPLPTFTPTLEPTED